MFAERVTPETDPTGLIHKLPCMPPNSKNEARLLVAKKSTPSPPEVVTHRKPHPDLAEQMRITGDIISSVPADSWNQTKAQ